MKLELHSIEGVPAVRPGDSLSSLLAEGIRTSGLEVRSGDVLVVCQKVVSKAEGRIADLRSIEPSSFAVNWGDSHEKDPRIIEVILREARRIVRMDQGHLIVETRHGFICANAGVDESNSLNDETLILLPEDPDRSAANLRRELTERLGVELAIIISDTFGRPWREGLVEVAIGVSGMMPLLDLRGSRDLTGRELHHTVVAAADELASAAGLLMEKGSGVPAVLVRGWSHAAGDGGARALVRDPAKDLFR